MPNASLPTTQKSPLEFIADEFWQDFMQNRPIDGGVAFEKELKRCQLDGSVASLCRVDAFLAFVGEQNTQKPDLFMTQGQTRNLVLFVGFYVGRILADAWHAYPHWLGQQELKEQHASLPIHPNNPFHFMALSYRPYDLKQGLDTAVNERLFFVLEPIAKRIFGQKLKMPAVQGGEIVPSVFEAVFERLPEESKDDAQGLSEQNKLQAQPLFASSTTGINTDANSTNAQSLNTQTLDAQSLATSNTTASHTDLAQTETPPPAHSSTHVVPTASDPASTSTAPTQTPSAFVATQQTVSTKPAIRNDEFKSLREELASLSSPPMNLDEPVSEDVDAMYGRANKVLVQLDKWVAQQAIAQGITVDMVKLGDKQRVMRDRALTVMRKATQAGHTRAMLRLASHYFLGEGVEKSSQKGFDLVYASASKGDAVAQRQLSRLYYQGIGCVQDMDMGREWLEKSASNGHEEAKQLLANWAMGEEVMAERQEDITTDQRYLIIIGVVILLGLIIAILI